MTAVILFSFVMYISVAKFEDHCFNFSGDILNSVFYRFSGRIYDVITSLVCIIQKRKYLLNEKTPFFFTLKGLSNNESLIFTLQAL